MQLERGTFFFLRGTSEATSFSFTRFNRSHFYQTRELCQLRLVRGQSAATSASTHPPKCQAHLLQGKDRFGARCWACGFPNALPLKEVLMSKPLNVASSKGSFLVHFRRIASKQFVRTEQWV